MKNNFSKKILPWLRILIFLVISLIIIFIVILIVAPEIILPEEKIEPEVISTEGVSLASGKQTFEIITDSSKTFKIIKVEVNPLDVKKGKSQQVQVLVKDDEDSPITYENKVEGVVFTDNKSVSFPFELKEVSGADGATLTTWNGFWTLEDTYDKTYMIKITAKSIDREHTIDLTFR
jgi:hypothetical protein